MTTKLSFEMIADEAIASGADIASQEPKKLVTAESLGDSFVSFRHGRTGNAGELVATLPMNGAYQVIFSKEVSLQVGDLIIALAEFQATTDETVFNVLVSSGLILSSTAGGNAAISGGEISEQNGINITPDMHHCPFSKNGTLISPVAGTYYVNLIARAASGSGTLPIVIDSDYGHLSVVQLRGPIGPLT